jgi:hypothetical protein
MKASRAMRSRAATATPTPMPILAPEARPELLLLPPFGEDAFPALPTLLVAAPVGLLLPRDGVFEPVCVGVALPEDGAAPALVGPLPPVPGPGELPVGLGSEEAGSVGFPEGV